MTDLDTRSRAPKTLRTSDNADDPSVSWKVKCLNCGAALAGPFCAECGQRAAPPHPTVAQIAGDAVQEIAGWDGKFADTGRTLLRRPGELTRQWIEGRRVHFISPFRLYLTASLVYFVTAAAAPDVLKSGNATVSVAGVNIGSGERDSRPQRVAHEAEKAMEGRAITAQERDSALKDIAKAPWITRPLLTKAVTEPTAVKAGILRWMPRILFALIPIYAGILAIFFRRRHYPEHFFFSIHLHAFVFLALTLSELMKMTRIVPLAAATSVLVSCWIVAYAILALRRVYGGTIGGTIAKSIGIMTLYCIVGAPVLLAAVFLSAF